MEAGLGFAVALDKHADFIRKEVLLRQKGSALAKRLVVFVLDDPEPLLLCNEPIYRDSVCAGLTTSAAFGHTIGKSVALGYVENEDGVDRSLSGRAGTRSSQPPNVTQRRQAFVHLATQRGCMFARSLPGREPRYLERNRLTTQRITRSRRTPRSSQDQFKHPVGGLIKPASSRCNLKCIYCFLPPEDRVVSLEGSPKAVHRDL